MASRKPDFRLPMPERPQADAAFQRPPSAKRSPRSPRSPRFHEDFDAPFSEALLNASRTTLATDASGSYLSSHSRTSLDVDNKRRASACATRRAQPPPASPLQLRQDSWTSSESTRRFTVNERIREWAKKSFVFARKSSEPSDDADLANERRSESKSDAVPPPAADNALSPSRLSSGARRQSAVDVAATATETNDSR